MTRLYCGVPVTDRVAALEWFEVFFGRQADEVVDGEVLWRITDSAWGFVEESAERAGRAVLTLEVDDFDEMLARLVAHGIEHEPVASSGNGVRHVAVFDPDGNSLSLAEAPTR
ncbi:VOC family protein [Saccharomonospora saliphila]|uniref:VOC family protein n=1 Tax=Saccharomonospora saliphila TaxID=369829 RepID=UPI0012FB135B|nr:VOC family protein [Saccharomonospora saliphila]